MKKFLINHGIVKTEQQANYLLVAIIILCFIFIFSQLGGSSSKQTNNESNEFTADDGQLTPGSGLDSSTQGEILP